jgi:hypothetical protein
LAWGSAAGNANLISMPVNTSHKRTLDRKLLSELARGAQMIFENAEALYREGRILGDAGAVSRALFLHQISLGKCAKIETVGVWATSLLAGTHRNQRRAKRGNERGSSTRAERFSMCLFVTCANAARQHSALFTFAALGLNDEVEYRRSPPRALCLHAMRREDRKRRAGLSEAQRQPVFDIH